MQANRIPVESTRSAAGRWLSATIPPMMSVRKSVCPACLERRPAIGAECTKPGAGEEGARLAPSA